MINSIVKLLENSDPVNRELGFNIAMGQGIGFLNQCIAACCGCLDMSETGISELPKGLIVSNNLYLIDCMSLQSLPDNLSVGGSLYLIGCTSLQSLPKGLKTGRWLDLNNCTALQSLPEGLSVGAWLDLSGCMSLQSLPDSLNVGSGLDISGCTALNISNILTIKGIAGRIIKQTN